MTDNRPGDTPRPAPPPGVGRALALVAAGGALLALALGVRSVLLGPSPAGPRRPAVERAVAPTRPSDGVERPAAARQGANATSAAETLPDPAEHEGAEHEGAAPIDPEAIREALVAAAPAEAIGIARAAMAAAPDHPDVPEWSARLVDALVANGDYRAARAEAERMVREYPGSPWARAVESKIGAHPRR